MKRPPLLDRLLLAVFLCAALQFASCAPKPDSPESTGEPPHTSTTSSGGDSSESETVMNNDPGNEALEEQSSPADDGKVLRHAVFFSFKDDATDEQVKTIVEAFRNLPNKIEEIIDFQWGLNNSPEGKDDGFTHCFLLTFADEAGRDIYLPHPAHKEFGSVLGGLNDQVFVIDYWGTPYASMDQELKHAVFIKFKETASPEEIRTVEEAFAELPSKIDAIKHFEWGTNNSPERHSAGFTHCFMVSFASEEGRDEYLPHPDHQAFVKLLVPVLDKVRVLDFWVEGKL